MQVSAIDSGYKANDSVMRSRFLGSFSQVSPSRE